MNPDGTPHPSNTRAHLVKVSDQFKNKTPGLGLNKSIHYLKEEIHLDGLRADIQHLKDHSIAVLAQTKYMDEKLLKNTWSYV